MIDYEALAIRSLDAPLAPGEWAALRVWADALEAAGDPRGALIALEHALRAEPARRRALGRAVHDHVVSHAAGGFGELAAHLHIQRGVTMDWRSGQLYGVALDTRRLVEPTGRTPGELVAMLLAAPVASQLRRLSVRAHRRGPADVIKALLEASPAAPLEELFVSTPLEGGLGSLAERYPGLRAVYLWRTPRPLPIGASRSEDEVRPLIAAAAPDTVDGRRVLGRALSDPGLARRDAALQRLGELGARAFMFVETLMQMLGRNVTWRPISGPQAPIVACLAGLGERARLAIPLLAEITGCAPHYEQATRRAAGAALVALAATAVT